MVDWVDQSDEGLHLQKCLMKIHWILTLNFVDSDWLNSLSSLVLNGDWIVLVIDKWKMNLHQRWADARVRTSPPNPCSSPCEEPLPLPRWIKTKFVSHWKTLKWLVREIEITFGTNIIWSIKCFVSTDFIWWHSCIHWWHGCSRWCHTRLNWKWWLYIGICRFRR